MISVGLINIDILVNVYFILMEKYQRVIYIFVCEWKLISLNNVSYIIFL
jgi:hypothetical protein